MINKSINKTIKILVVSLAIVSLFMTIFIATKNNSNKLPPVENGETTTNTKTEERKMEGISFYGFDYLIQEALSEDRVKVLQYHLCRYVEKANRSINSFSLEQGSVTSDLSDDTKLFNFQAIDNLNNLYKIKMSYKYPADNIVQIYNNTLLYQTPFEPY